MMPESMEEEGDLGLLPEGWERSETAAGIPYYVNHGGEITQWEHPRTSEVFIQLDGMNDIKFGAYRTAMKLSAIRKMTHLNMVKCHMLERAYKELAIGPGSKHNNETYTVHELEALLTSAFQYANQERATNVIDVEESVELTQNFLLKCLDSGRTGRVKVRTLKNVLTTLAHSTLEDKYSFLFQHVCKEDSAGISQPNLKALLLDLLLLTNSVAESSTFAPETIDDAIKNCWESTKLFEPTYILNKEEFLDWMFKEPVCIVWLPTLYRLTSSETVKHEAKCAKCKAYPIVGFRYRCLKCMNVDLCQGCYWTQKTMKNHKLSHPTREYCLATTTGDDVRDFAKQLKNKLTRRYRRQPLKVSYLKYPITPRNPEANIPDECPVLENVHTRVNLLAERLQELEEGRSEFTGSAPASIIEHVSNARSQPPPSIRQPAAVPESSRPSQPPAVEVHPIVPLVHQATQSSLKGTDEIDSHMVELQAANDAEVQARVELERSLLEVQGSVVEELEARVELEQKVHDLHETNLLLKERVSQLLATSPLTTTVRVPASVSVLSPPSSVVEMKHKGVNTANTSGLPGDKWSFTLGSQVSTLLGGEEEEMDTILKELLAAFPRQKKGIVAGDMSTALFQAGATVRDSFTLLAHHMDNY